MANLTFLLMDAPFENQRTVTALRLVDAALRKGHDVTVFAYEGAAALTFARQTQHANAVHGRDLAQEDHPLPKEWAAALLRTAQENGRKLEWVNCGLCVDERGVNEFAPGAKRGAPSDFWKAAESSQNTLVIATR